LDFHQGKAELLGPFTNSHEYNPFVRGPFPVGVRSMQLEDTARNLVFPSEFWYPATALYDGQDISPATQDIFTFREIPRRQMAIRDAVVQPGRHPLVIYSHPSLFHRRAATFLCTHLGSHGYVVAGLDHSEVVANMGPAPGETAEQKTARFQAVLASRVPDVRFLLNEVLSNKPLDPGAEIDPTQIGIVGHSLGGWAALAATEAETRIHAVVALAPAGASNPRPGVLPAKLNFAWGRDVPALYLVAENDVPLPLSGMYELFERTRATKQMVILRRADHAHFMDGVEELHESFRNMPATGDLAQFQKETLPISALCSGEQAYLFTRGLTLGHMDATLRRQVAAQRFMSGDLKTELATRGVDVIVHRS
jgi:dienelactone hydrolase